MRIRTYAELAQSGVGRAAADAARAREAKVPIAERERTDVARLSLEARGSEARGRAFDFEKVEDLRSALARGTIATRADVIAARIAEEG